MEVAHLSLDLLHTPRPAGCHCFVTAVLVPAIDGRGPPRIQNESNILTGSSDELALTDTLMGTNPPCHQHTGHRFLGVG